MDGLLAVGIHLSVRTGSAQDLKSPGSGAEPGTMEEETESLQLRCSPPALAAAGAAPHGFDPRHPLSGFTPGSVPFLALHLQGPASSLLLVFLGRFLQ